MKNKIIRYILIFLLGAFSGMFFLVQCTEKESIDVKKLKIKGNDDSVIENLFDFKKDD